MVNYRRVLCDVAVLLAVIAYAAAAPAPCNDDRVYDQRQNGSENYRVNIDGVVFAVAPADSIFSDIDFTDFLDLDIIDDEKPSKPDPSDFLSGELSPSKPGENNSEPPKPEDKPLEAKPDEKPSEAKPDDKPEEKPSEAKPDDKPEESKPGNPETPLKVPETKSEKGQKKSTLSRKQENTQRLKQRLASLFLPFLRKRRHQ